MKIAIIVGSTRPGRKAPAVARWVAELAAGRDADYTVIDIAEAGLPLLDEPLPPAAGQYQNEHSKAWAAVIAPFDGYIFVTPEYNHSVPASLKNAIDYLWTEWNDKAVAFVSYGAAGGTRAVEHLRLITANLKLAGVRTQVSLSIFGEVSETEVTPHEGKAATVKTMLDELEAWASALATLRMG